MKLKREKIACVFNYPSHYRQEIYECMERELDCDFYFGDSVKGRIAPIDFNKFRKKIVSLKTINLISNFNWILGSVNLTFKKYNAFVLVGDPFIISNWLIMFFCMFFNKKTYLWTHGWYGNETVLKKVLKKFYYKLSEGIFLYGDYAKKLMIDEKFKESSLHVVYNSLNYEQQYRIRQSQKETNVYKLHFNNDNKTILFVGRLTTVKKLDLIINAQKELLNKHAEVNVIFIGDGPEEESLKSLGKELKLKNIWFYGPLYDEEKLGELLYNADLCVSPGNVGLTAIHALCFGLPIMTHNDFSTQMPEFESVIDGCTGSFFDKNDTISLVENIESWFDSHQDREKVREQCFKVIDDKFNPNYQMEVFKRVLL